MKTIERTVALLAALFVVPAVARPADDPEVWAQSADAAPPAAQPTSPAPTDLPPPPPPPGEAALEDAQAQAQPAAPGGQWVYTEQYGWVWMPVGGAYTYVPPDGSAPDMYLYYPSVGWCWVVAPWVWGLGPMPYFGVYGASRFGWYGHGFGRWYGYRHAGWYAPGYWRGGRWNGYVRGNVAPARGGYAAPSRGGHFAPVHPGTSNPRPGWGRPVPPRTGMVGPRGGASWPAAGFGPRPIAPRGSFAAHGGGPRGYGAAPRGAGGGGFGGRGPSAAPGSGGHGSGGHRGGGHR
jgi:hypothetical protein